MSASNGQLICSSVRNGALVCKRSGANGRYGVLIYDLDPGPRALATKYSRDKYASGTITASSRAEAERWVRTHAESLLDNASWMGSTEYAYIDSLTDWGNDEYGYVLRLVARRYDLKQWQSDFGDFTVTGANIRSTSNHHGTFCLAWEWTDADTSDPPSSVSRIMMLPYDTVGVSGNDYTYNFQVALPATAQHLWLYMWPYNFDPPASGYHQAKMQDIYVKDP